MKPIKFLDILVVILILFNIGAMVITNILAVKNEPDVEFGEANLDAAKTFDLKPLPDEQAQILFKMIIFKGLLYGLIVGMYYLLRINYQKNNSNMNLVKIVFSVFILLFIFAFDFFNNFGYLLGVIFYGT